MTDYGQTDQNAPSVWCKARKDWALSAAKSGKAGPAASQDRQLAMGSTTVRRLTAGLAWIWPKRRWPTLLSLKFADDHTGGNHPETLAALQGRESTWWRGRRWLDSGERAKRRRSTGEGSRSPAASFERCRLRLRSYSGKRSWPLKKTHGGEMTVGGITAGGGLKAEFLWPYVRHFPQFMKWTKLSTKIPVSSYIKKHLINAKSFLPNYFISYTKKIYARQDHASSSTKFG